MLYGEYRLEDEIAVVKKEVREEAWEEAWEESRKVFARNSLAKGLTPEFVYEITGLDLETIQGLVEK